MRGGGDEGVRWWAGAPCTRMELQRTRKITAVKMYVTSFYGTYARVHYTHIIHAYNICHICILACNDRRTDFHT